MERNKALIALFPVPQSGSDGLQKGPQRAVGVCPRGAQPLRVPLCSAGLGKGERNESVSRGWSGPDRAVLPRNTHRRIHPARSVAHTRETTAERTRGASRVRCKPFVWHIERRARVKKSNQIRARMYGGGSHISSPPPAPRPARDRAPSRATRGEGKIPKQQRRIGPCGECGAAAGPAKQPRERQREVEGFASILRRRGEGNAGSFFWPGTPEQRVQRLIIFLSVLGYCRCPPRLPQ